MRGRAFVWAVGRGKWQTQLLRWNAPGVWERQSRAPLPVCVCVPPPHRPRASRPGARARSTSVVDTTPPGHGEFLAGSRADASGRRPSVERTVNQLNRKTAAPRVARGGAPGGGAPRARARGGRAGRAAAWPPPSRTSTPHLLAQNGGAWLTVNTSSVSVARHHCRLPARNPPSIPRRPSTCRQVWRWARLCKWGDRAAPWMEGLKGLEGGSAGVSSARTPSMTTCPVPRRVPPEGTASMAVVGRGPRQREVTPHPCHAPQSRLLPRTLLPPSDRGPPRTAAATCTAAAVGLGAARQGVFPSRPARECTQHRPNASHPWGAHTAHPPHPFLSRGSAGAPPARA